MDNINLLDSMEINNVISSCISNLTGFSLSAKYLIKNYLATCSINTSIDENIIEFSMYDGDKFNYTIVSNIDFSGSKIKGDPSEKLVISSMRFSRLTI